MANGKEQEENNSTSSLEEYKVGDKETRPWGEYVVTATSLLDGGKDFCEKIITVMPGKILSLQSHDKRAEVWRVEEGKLTVILDGKLFSLQEGESIDIPLKAIHCMANMTDKPCKVCEKQEGICREEDIVRYIDAYGRETLPFSESNITDSIALYRDILEKI